VDIVNDIVNGAVDDTVKLATLLRKLLIVGDSLDNERLKEWVLHELNGYEAIDQLPPYRTMEITAKGQFLSVVGQMNDQPIPSAVLKKEHQWWAETAYLLSAIASFEALVEGDPNGRVITEWPANMTAYYSDKFNGGWKLNRAWQEIPTNAIRGMLDNVRTRILQFALELKREVGDSELSADAAPPEKVNSAVQTIIYGCTNIISPTIAGDVQVIGQQVVVQGDFFSLSGALEAIGVDPTHVAKLKAAIAEDKADGDNNGYGSRVKGWLAKAGSYVAKESGAAAVDVAKSAITTAVTSYFGLG
jgi:AbiTii